MERSPIECREKLLLYESCKVIARIQDEIELEVRKIDPENYDRNHEKLDANMPDLEEDWKNGEAKHCRK